MSTEILNLLVRMLSSRKKILCACLVQKENAVFSRKTTQRVTLKNAVFSPIAVESHRQKGSQSEKKSSKCPDSVLQSRDCCWNAHSSAETARRYIKKTNVKMSRFRFRMKKLLLRCPSKRWSCPQAHQKKKTSKCPDSVLESRNCCRNAHPIPETDRINFFSLRGPSTTQIKFSLRGPLTPEEWAILDDLAWPQHSGGDERGGG